MIQLLPLSFGFIIYLYINNDITYHSKLRRRAFKTNVVIHYPLKGTIASWLFQEYSIITLHKPVTRYVHRIQHVNPVDPVPRY
jgi:hypothetical protein